MVRIELFPITTRIAASAGRSYLEVSGCDLHRLAERYGTPLYLYDQATLDDAVLTYRQALSRHYPGEGGLTYAGKAYLCLALAQWAGRQGLWVDCTGAGELDIVAAAGLERERILVHGVNKGPADLAAAAACAGTVVVDNRVELQRWIDRAARGEAVPDFWLRLQPGLAVQTHAHRQTGQAGSKFGMVPAELREAAHLALRAGLRLTGLHWHQGSHFSDLGPAGPALETALDLVAALHADSGWLPQVLCPGGGWAVAYHEDDLPHPPVEAYVAFLAAGLQQGCRQRGLAPLPRLQLEPGRSLVARAGVALYRVGAVKVAAGQRWLLLDGGMADNPRPALYGARYTALPVDDPLRPQAGPAWFGGPCCESGDALIHGLPMPEVEVGELIAVPVSGAYQLSMASNYNGTCRPAVLWLQDGAALVIQEREAPADLWRRDRPLPPQ